MIGDPGQPSVPTEEQWACIVTYPNRSAEETARLAEEVLFQVGGDVATISFPFGVTPKSATLYVDFGNGAVRVE